MTGKNHNFKASEKPGLYENLGIRIFRYLSKKYTLGDEIQPDRSDSENLLRIRKITITSYITAFAVGAVSAGGSVAAELAFPEDACMEFLSYSCLTKYAWVTLATVLLTIIEFAVLIWMSIYTVFHISLISGHIYDMDIEDTMIQIPNLLSRAALEIPDPVRHILGIDPFQKISKYKLLIFGIFYKLKVLLSNVLAKLIIRRVLGKSALRVGADFIAVPVTGLWNALVMYRVAREATLRLFGNLLAKHLSESITEDTLSRLSENARLCCLQAVGNSIVLTQNYHPNMIILMMKLLYFFGSENRRNLDNWDLFVENFRTLNSDEKIFVMDLLAVSAAFDGKFSRLEKLKLSEIFQEYTEVYYKKINTLKNLMYSGKLTQAKDECRLDFTPG